MTTYSQGPNVISDVVDGCLTVCNTVSGEVLELNGTGAALWTWCENATAPALAARLADLYPSVEANLIRADVRQWLSDADAAGLLQVNDELTED